MDHCFFFKKKKSIVNTEEPGSRDLVLADDEDGPKSQGSV